MAKTKSRGNKTPQQIAEARERERAQNEKERTELANPIWNHLLSEDQAGFSINQAVAARRIATQEAARQLLSLNDNFGKFEFYFDISTLL